jgi:alpha-D-xyloside xylohydrolase
MGPVMEYATEKPANNIELRIYPGANGQFEYYEDENDNYNYEKGKSATFNLNWDDKKHILTISTEKGSFPGMLKQHTFNIILVKGMHGSDMPVTSRPDKTIVYNGKLTTVNL